MAYVPDWNRGVTHRTMDGLALVRDQDWAYQGALVRSTWNPERGSSREYVWTDDAACKDADPDLFQVSRRGDPGTEGLGTHAVNKFNKAKVEEAKVYCEGCPVRATCLEQAEPNDLYWSVRGGATPLAIRPRRENENRAAHSFPADKYLK
jgi:ferredoxin